MSAGDTLINPAEAALADALEPELEWWDEQDWSGISDRERRAIFARHLAMHVRTSGFLAGSTPQDYGGTE